MISIKGSRMTVRPLDAEGKPSGPPTDISADPADAMTHIENVDFNEVAANGTFYPPLRSISFECTFLGPDLETIALLVGEDVADLSQSWDTHIERGTN